MEAELEVIEEGEEVAEDGLVGVAEGFLFLAGEAFADIIEFRAGTKELVFEGGDLVCGKFLWGEGGREGEGFNGSGGERGIERSSFGWGGCLGMLGFNFRRGHMFDPTAKRGKV